MANKNKHFKIIILNEDFGNNIKGTVIRSESILASRLISKKIASLYEGKLEVGSVELLEIQTKTKKK